MRIIGKVAAEGPQLTLAPFTCSGSSLSSAVAFGARHRLQVTFASVLELDEFSSWTIYIKFYFLTELCPLYWKHISSLQAQVITAFTSLIPSFFPQIQKAVHKSKENAALSWRGWGEGQEGNRFHGTEVINVTVYDEGNEN